MPIAWQKKNALCIHWGQVRLFGHHISGRIMTVLRKNGNMPDDASIVHHSNSMLVMLVAVFCFKNWAW